MFETKFGTPQVPTDFNCLSLAGDSLRVYDEIASEIKSIKFPSFGNQSLSEILAFIRSNEHHDSFQKLNRLYYSYAILMMKNNMYEEAITTMERQLNSCNASGFTFRDPFLKSRHHMQLGHSYRHLRINDKALKYYELVLGENVGLPLDEHVGILVGYGKVLDAMNNYKDALYQYIEVSEIYINNSSICSADERQDIEKCVERVFMQRISID
ncbi:unnamed protein product [Adineta ricciae]|uniref:Uncharacterized protein n=1 Tax=Adineta ricciae TaxID=249248 RepID=A0A815UJR3_ADIRI|nr:unnamed protein product [Adineta ricciae]CAF1523563.1 unnamed protein product [Adineta ricciae]